MSMPSSYLPLEKFRKKKNWNESNQKVLGLSLCLLDVICMLPYYCETEICFEGCNLWRFGFLIVLLPRIIRNKKNTMKVAAFNGSPHKEGNTYHALKIVADALNSLGIETEIIHVGNKKVQGCMACNTCVKNRNEQCVIISDDVNVWVQKMKEADGILLGSPVHYAALGATMKSFLDRAFYVAGANGGLFRHKVGAAIAAVRRSGGLPTFNELNNYLNYSEMVIPASNYWNVIHGTKPGEALKDAEGVQIMEVLAKNMVWVLKLIENGRKTGIEEPEKDKKVYTNFVR